MTNVLWRKLDRTDWDFSSCPDDELINCRYYEFARELAFMGHNVGNPFKGVTDGRSNSERGWHSRSFLSKKPSERKVE